MTDLIEPGVSVEVWADGVRLANTVALEVTRTAGAASGDRCLLRGLRDSLLVDTLMHQAVQTIEVKVVVGDGQTKARRIFWGQTSGSIFRLKDEVYQGEARVARFHFGRPLSGEVELHPDNKLVTLARHPVFNPLIDGRNRGNMNDQAQGSGRYYTFIDYESLRTEAARKQQRYSHTSDRDFKAHYFDEFWTLPEAVLTLCWTLNGEQKFFKNPTRGELEQALDRSPQLIRDVRLRLGMYLNEALDVLLGPLGYLWSLEYDTKGKPELRFHERGKGPQRQVRLQRPGSGIRAEKNNTADCTIATGLQSLMNQVRGIGDRKQWETSVILKAGWKQEYDELGYDETDKNGETYQQNPKYHDVHRLFIANEDGSGCGLRDEWKEPLDLAPIFKQHRNPGDTGKRLVVPRRRRARPCLTTLPGGVPIGMNGYVLKWKEATPAEIESGEPEEDADWRDIEEANFGDVRLLHDRLGICFEGPLPPPECVALAGRIWFQLTCTIEDDERLEYLSRRDAGSPQTETVEEVVDAGDRFQYRKVHPKSRHFEDVEAKRKEADEQDDEVELKEYSNRLRQEFDQADVSAAPTVIGLTEKYAIGETVTKIEGRELRFDARSDGAADQRYPQIVGITLDLVGQSQQLHLETLRNVAL